LQDRVQSIVQLLQTIKAEASSPYNDGWVGADCKKDLIFIRYELNKLIKDCPNFGAEEKKWEQEILMMTLKEK